MENINTRTTLRNESEKIGNEKRNKMQQSLILRHPAHPADLL